MEEEDPVDLVLIWRRFCKDYKEIEPSVELFPATENILTALLYDMATELTMIREEMQRIDPT